MIDHQTKSVAVCMDEIASLEKRLAEAEAKIPRWIPVSEGLPNIYVEVIALAGDGSVAVGHIDNLKIFVADAFDIPAFENDASCPRPETRITSDVTHWMPLPRQPKEDGDD